MGMLKADSRVEVRVVMTGPVNAKVGNGPKQKAIVWILEDKRLVIATGGATGKTVIQTEYTIDHVAESKDQTIVYLDDGTLVYLDKLQCRCGMGVVGSARVMKERHRIVRVSPPDWVQPA